MTLHRGTYLSIYQKIKAAVMWILQSNANLKEAVLKHAAQTLADNTTPRLHV